MKSQVGDTIAEANENAMLELKSRVVFLENFIKKYQVCNLPYLTEGITLVFSIIVLVRLRFIKICYSVEKNEVN